MSEETYAFIIAFENGRHVSQVVFALTIRGTHLLEREEQFIGIKTVDSRIYFTNLSFVFSGVPLLYDFAKAVLGVAHDATIARRVLHSDGENCASGVLIPVYIQQLIQRLCAYQRNISGQNQKS